MTLRLSRIGRLPQRLRLASAASRPGTAPPVVVGGPYDLNFSAGSYQTPSGMVADPVAAGLLSFSRPSALTVPDSTGKFVTFPANQIARNDVGLWQRKQTRRNDVPNSVLAGGAAGTPGTLPTGMTGTLVGSAGLTRSVAYGTDEVRGLAYMEHRYQGTTTSGGSYAITLASGIPAAANEWKSISAYLGVSQGVLPADGTTRCQLVVRWFNGATQINEVALNDRVMARDTALRRHKQALQAPANATSYTVLLTMVVKSGVAYDHTIRIAQPQAEAVTAATDDASLPILTSGAAVTAQADAIALTGPTLAYLTGGAGTIEPTTADLRGSGIDYRDERPLITINGNLLALKRTSDGRIASDLAGAPRTYKSWRTQFAWEQRHAVAWDASGAKVASTSPALATAAAAGSVPAISSVSLDVDGCIKRLVLRNTAADLTGYNAISADVIQYGATSGGIVGAAAAIRAGVSSRVVGGWREVQPGGMATGGLGAVDASDLTVFGGLGRDYATWCAEYDGKGDPNSKAISSKTALLFFDYLVRRFRINQHWSKGVVTATKNATTKRVSGFTTTLGQTVTGKSFVDSSYEGDLIAAAGVTFTVGREAKTTANPFNGNRATQPYTTASAGLSDHQFTPVTGGGHTTILNIDPYRTAGSAGSGLLPGVQAGGAGTLDAADGAIQAYCFRTTVTTNAALKAGAAPLVTAGSPPPGYSALTYELLGRYFGALTAAGKTAVGIGTTPGTDQYNIGLFYILNTIGNYFDLNSNNGFSIDTFGANWGAGWADIMQAAGVTSPSANYAVATYAEREIFWKWQENFQRGMWYFLAYSGDSRIPAVIASDAASFGLANDHYLDPHENDTPNWMTNLYVREARRMVGMLVLNHTDITAATGSAPRSLNTVGVLSYAIDSHHVRRFADTSTGVARVVNEGNIFVTLTKTPKQAPIAAEYLTPQAADCTNLFATFASSAAHTGFGALRMEVAHMGSAEAAGIMSAQVVKQATQPNVQDWIASAYASDIRPALLAVGINAPQVN
ncbi:hypothetical protein FHR71_005421 [Methylobacterium sp. RAS18]|nr:hypothetical protein [Methylobacterium sp. RAS18]